MSYVKLYLGIIWFLVSWAAEFTVLSAVIAAPILALAYGEPVYLWWLLLLLPGPLVMVSIVHSTYFISDNDLF